MNFNNKEFATWRSQFGRVTFLDSLGTPLSVKGHIVATRFATEESGSRLQSGIWAEDPLSPGERAAGPDQLGALGRVVISSHYSSIAEKLSQPVLANALANGVPLPDELRVVGVAWRVIAGPLAGRRFVGGYFSSGGDLPAWRERNGKLGFERPDFLRLNRPNATFFGIEEGILKQVVAMARAREPFVQQISGFEPVDFFYSGFSVLRDGSALGPLDWFLPEEQVEF
ncbi:hypothetical protein GTP55_10420 [Duganella sp. FT109W]|uniref:Uncharacterized protein n=1 Tax=Duganella margarita TaxID=2692170 RepID=A0ABW9WFB2_9BURK|nr:hypothetical protein [Duganella margarita]MYN39787.1 hypothetical protein [Duganella margarita]